MRSSSSYSSSPASAPPVAPPASKCLAAQRAFTYQVQPLMIVSPHVRQALESIDRRPFLPASHRDYAYADAPIILKRRCEMPFYLIAALLQKLAIPADAAARGLRGLVISAGAGYSATLLARLCHHVDAFEGDVSLYARLLEAGQRTPNLNPTLTLPTEPVDVIMMDGGALDAIPQPLYDKLRPGGRLVILQLRASTPPPVFFSTETYEEYALLSPAYRSGLMPLVTPLCDAYVYTCPPPTTASTATTPAITQVATPVAAAVTAVTHGLVPEYIMTCHMPRLYTTHLG